MKSRIELFLNAIKTGNISNLPKPQSRVEHFLKGIATGDISSLPKPQSRVEECLDFIARNGSSSGGNNDYTFYNIGISERIENLLNLEGRISDKILIEVVEV